MHTTHHPRQNCGPQGMRDGVSLFGKNPTVREIAGPSLEHSAGSPPLHGKVLVRSFQIPAGAQSPAWSHNLPVTSCSTCHPRQNCAPPNTTDWVSLLGGNSLMQGETCGLTSVHPAPEKFLGPCRVQVLASCSMHESCAHLTLITAWVLGHRVLTSDL